MASNLVLDVTGLLGKAASGVTFQRQGVLCRGRRVIRAQGQPVQRPRGSGRVWELQEPVAGPTARSQMARWAAGIFRDSKQGR